MGHKNVHPFKDGWGHKRFYPVSRGGGGGAQHIADTRFSHCVMTVPNIPNLTSVRQGFKEGSHIEYQENIPLYYDKELEHRVGNTRYAYVQRPMGIFWPQSNLCSRRFLFTAPPPPKKMY